MPRGVAREPHRAAVGTSRGHRRAGPAGPGRRALAALGYRVSGWSRTPKPDLAEGITGYHGADGLPALLAQADTLVCLLPLTDETRGFLGAATFARLPRGAHVVNAGRGEHLDPTALLAALDSGQLSYATLDATRRSRCRPTTRCGAIPGDDHAPHRHPHAGRRHRAADAGQPGGVAGGTSPDTCADAALGY